MYDNKPLQGNHTSAFDKIVYAIKSNPIKEAGDYLKTRGVEVNTLPKGSYWYDSHSDAIVFIDSDNRLINLG